jgi:hypothetical protein
MARLDQISVDVTPQIKTKLADLESELESLNVRQYEIVAVLIQRASADKSISATDLARYRTEHKAHEPRR